MTTRTTTQTETIPTLTLRLTPTQRKIQQRIEEMRRSPDLSEEDKQILADLEKILDTCSTQEASDIILRVLTQYVLFSPDATKSESRLRSKEPLLALLAELHPKGTDLNPLIQQANQKIGPRGKIKQVIQAMLESPHFFPDVKQVLANWDKVLENCGEKELIDRPLYILTQYIHRNPDPASLMDNLMRFEEPLSSVLQESLPEGTDLDSRVEQYTENMRKARVLDKKIQLQAAQALGARAAIAAVTQRVDEIQTAQFKSLRDRIKQSNAARDEETLALNEILKPLEQEIQEVKKDFNKKMADAKTLSDSLDGRTIHQEIAQFLGEL